MLPPLAAPRVPLFTLAPPLISISLAVKTTRPPSAVSVPEVCTEIVARSPNADRGVSTTIPPAPPILSGWASEKRPLLRSVMKLGRGGTRLRHARDREGVRCGDRHVPSTSLRERLAAADDLPAIRQIQSRCIDEHVCGVADPQGTGV